MDYKDEYIIERVKQLDDYKYIPEGYWLLGIRSDKDEANKFDDTFKLFKGEKSIITTTGTTNPGITVLKHGWKKYNKDGVAILESDRIYYNVYQSGLHKGYMPALIQTGAPVTVYRDGDNDAKSEEQGKKQTGYFGINFHTATRDFDKDIIKEDINGWSAGCQVANRTKEYNEIIDLTKSQKFTTYVLLKEFSV